MKKIFFYLAIYFGVSFSACTSQAEKQNNNEKKDGSLTTQSDTLALIKNKCFSCHNPDTNIDFEKRLAPPMFKIREHYIDDTITKEAFVNNILTFVSNPNQETSIMPGAVNNFGLMPKQDFSKEDIKQIAAYIFENDLASDEWYSRWDIFNKESKK